MGTGSPDDHVALLQCDFYLCDFARVELCNFPIFAATALTQGELLTFYAMLSVATAIAGADFFAVIITHIAVGGWMATEENEWATLFHVTSPIGWR